MIIIFEAQKKTTDCFLSVQICFRFKMYAEEMKISISNFVFELVKIKCQWNLFLNSIF